MYIQPEKKTFKVQIDGILEQIESFIDHLQDIPLFTMNIASLETIHTKPVASLARLFKSRLALTQDLKFNPRSRLLPCKSIRALIFGLSVGLVTKV